MKADDVIRTPKNAKIDNNNFAPICSLKKMSFNKFRGEDSTNLSNNKNNFDKDF